MKILKKFVVIIISTIISLIIFINNNCYATTAVVNTDTLKLRQEASTTSTVLELLNQGQKLEIVEESGDWYKVKVNNMTGYVNKNYIKVNEDSQVENQTTEPQEDLEETNTQIPETTEEPTNVNNDEQTNNTVLQNREITLSKDTNVYILPLVNSNKISTIKKDSKITIISEINNWIYIQTEEINGWIIQEQLEISNQDENVQEPTNTDKQENNNNTQNTTTTQNEQSSETEIARKTLYVNSASVYVRKGPGTDYEVVDSLIKNAQVIAIAENGDWYKVEVGGNTGYIAKRLLSASKQEETTSRGADERQTISSKEENLSNNQNTDTNASKGEQIAAYAKQYLGCKYSYGASGPSTFDCSGFTMYVYKNFGISLSHSAIAQSKNGTAIAKEDLQAGDLVFFKDYPSMEGIGHVGIYIGNGNFIHASSGTGYCVKISTLLSGSYNTRYETARRLI